MLVIADHEPRSQQEAQGARHRLREALQIHSDALASDPNGYASPTSPAAHSTDDRLVAICCIQRMATFRPSSLSSDPAALRYEANEYWTFTLTPYFNWIGA